MHYPVHQQLLIAARASSSLWPRAVSVRTERYIVHTQQATPEIIPIATRLIHLIFQRPPVVCLNLGHVCRADAARYQIALKRHSTSLAPSLTPKRA